MMDLRRGITTGLLLTSMGMLVGCGLETEEGVLPDSEISEATVESTNAALDVTTTPGAPAASHVKVAWGYLAGNRAWNREWVDWSGGLGVSAGKVTLEHLVYFDRGDRPEPTNDTDQVRWLSRTGPHYDGLVVKVEPSTADAKVHLGTPPFSVDLDAAELATGIERHVVVDAAGHEVAISSIPDSDCGGFTFGYERPSREGWLAFGGRVTDASGQLKGILRFRAHGHALQARLLGQDKAVLVQGTGQLQPAADAHGSESFELALTKPDGSALGTVHGIFNPPSYSPRGSFEGTLSCP